MVLRVLLPGLEHMVASQQLEAMLAQPAQGPILRRELRAVPYVVFREFLHTEHFDLTTGYRRSRDW